MHSFVLSRKSRENTSLSIIESIFVAESLQISRDIRAQNTQHRVLRYYYNGTYK